MTYVAHLCDICQNIAPTKFLQKMTNVLTTTHKDSGGISPSLSKERSPLCIKKSLNIKEIGYALGFEDPSYFVKFFKRMEGIMPSEFRKEL